MKTRRLLGTTTCLAVVAGCSMIAHSDGAGAGPTVVTVGDLAGGGCKVTAPGPINVKGKQSPVLQWRLSDPGKYKFASNGIAFDKPGYTPPPGEFTSQGINAQGAFLVKDNNHAKGRFDYSIHVIVKATNKTCDADPIVYNDGSCPEGGC